MAEDIPLILDDAMSGMAGMSGDVPVGLGDVDVDDVDLFGGPVELSLPSNPPPSKQLQVRVNEQRIRGCNQCVYLPRKPYGDLKLTTIDESHGPNREPLPPSGLTANPSSFAIYEPMPRMRHGA